MRAISRWKRILGIGLAMGVLTSVTVTSVPVQASSILDKVTSEETTEDYAEDTSYSRLKGNNLNKFRREKLGFIGLEKIDLYELEEKFIKETDIYNYLFLIVLLIPLLLYIFIAFFRPTYFNKLYTGYGIFVLIGIILAYTIFIYIVKNLLEAKDE